MKKVSVILLVAILALFMAACGSTTTPAQSGDVSENSPSVSDNDSTNVPDSGDEIVIGCLQDITGVTSPLGKMVVDGATWAVDEINAAGGVNGKTIKMITYDTKNDTQEAINAFTRMCTTDKVSAVIGPPISNIGIAIAPISEEYNIPVLGFFMDKRATSKEDGTLYKNMFLFEASADQQGSIMANFAVNEEGFKKFGVIYDQSNAYCVSLVDAFKNALGTLDAEITVEVPYQANDKDFKTMISKIESADVDAIYAPNYTQQLILIAQQARSIGFDGPMIAGIDACPPFCSLCGPEADNIYYIDNITDTDPQIHSISEQYKEKTDNDITSKFFLGYDVMNIIAETVGKVGDDPAAVRDEVEHLTDYQGLIGNITMDPSTHQITGLEMFMHRIENQTPELLGSFSAAN